MQIKHFQEHIFFTTVRIVLPHDSGKGTSIGTGFLYKAPVSEAKTCILLVSNRHVYGDPDKPIQLVFHRRNEQDRSKPVLGHTITFSDSRFGAVFTGHPNPDVDLACINISQIGHHTPPVFFKVLGEENLPDFQHEHLLPGNDAWFVGYPANRFDTTNNLPVLRKGYIASIPTVDFEGQPQFLIDAQVFPGSSGSPVFTRIGSAFHLAGIVSATMIKNEHVQAVPAASALAVQQVLGLGIVLKASLLPPLIEAATRAIRYRLSNSEDEPTLSQQEDSDQVGGAD